MKKLISFSFFFLLLMIPLITSAQDVLVNLNSYTFSSEDVIYEEFTDGTATGVSGDDGAANFNLPFSFMYAGVEFTQVRICTNGWVAVGTNTLTSYTNDLASPTYLKFLAACWDDLNMDATIGDITYRTEGEAPYRVFAVQFRNSQRLGSTTDNLNYQIRIHETTGVITFTYGTMTSTYTAWSASIGINGLVGGVNDFISVTPTDPPTASSTVANNAIDVTGITSLTNKKYTFTPADFVTLLEPYNNANNVSVTPMFSWEALEGYVSYTIQVSTVSDFSFLVIEESGIENTYYQVPEGSALDESSVYYWRVKATDLEGFESNWSGVRTFATEGNIPPIALVSPANNAIGIIVLPTFTWLQNLAATYYEIEVATDPDFYSIVANGIDISATNWLLPAANVLENNTQYFWRVRGYTGDNIGEWSEVWSFTTLTMVNTNSYIVLEQDNALYEEFTDGTPTISGDDNGANYPLPFTFVYAGVEFNMVRICTNGWVGIGGDITHNALGNDLASTAYFRLLAACWDDLNVVAGTGDITYRTEGVSPNQAFVVQFRNISRLGSSGESLNFQIRLYESTGEISFTYGTMNASYASWSASVGITGLAGGIMDFISSTPGNPSTFSSTVANNSINAAGVTLLTNKKYTFLPMGDYVMLTSPLNNSITETNVTLDWEDFAGASSYQLQVSTTADFSTTIVDEDALTISTFDLEGLEELTRYFWRARAFVEEEYTYWSSVWTFITTGELPAPTLIAPENGMLGTDPALRLRWERNVFATGYTLQVATDEDFTSIILEETGIANNFYNLGGLSMNTQYFWRVQMYNTFNTSEWCDAWTFTTGNFVVVGIGENYDTDYYNYVSPSPYSNWYTHARLYFLYTADELLAGGAIPDSYITNFGWNIAMLQGGVGPLNPGEFSIRMKLTTWTQLTSAWDYEDWSTVWEPETPFTAALGWNMHQCIDPFYWDGVSSILVETCFSHWNTIGYPNPQQFWTTTEVARCQQRSVYEPSGPEQDYCTIEDNIGWGGPKMNRANIKFSLAQSVLTTPVLISPETGSFAVPLAPLFTWNPVEGASSYTIQVSTSYGFETPIIVEEGLTETEFQVPAGSELNEMTTYYWRVNATDGENTSFWSSKWNFITVGNLPEPVLISPANNTTGLAPSTLLTWEPYFAATGYNVQVALTDDFEDPVISATVLGQTSYITEGLAMGTQYYWRVQMFNDATTGEYCDPWTFTTGNFVIVGTGTSYDTDYYNYVSPSPYSNWYHHARLYFLYTAEELLEAGAIPNSYIVNFGWNVAVNQGGVGALNPGEYAIRMKLTTWTQLNSSWDYEDWSTVWEPSEPWIAALGWNMHQCIDPFFWDGVSSILVETCFSHWQTIGYPNPQQYWTYTPQARCQQRSVYEPSGPELDYCTIENNIGWGGPKNNRANIKFELATSVLSTPVLAAPPTGSFAVPLTPLFTWNPVEGASSYSIQVSTTYGFETPVISEEGITETEFQVPASSELSELTTYYWRVNATDGENTSFWSTKWNFITIGDLPPAVLLSPENNATDVAPSTVLTWEAYFAATGYNVQVATDEAFENLIINATGITGTSYITSGLAMNSQYYWRVQMYNDANISDWCLPWIFTTGNYVVIGTGAGYDTDYYNYVSPSPYSNWYDHARIYFLYTAEELLDGGAIPNTYITDFGWNVAINQANIGPLNPGEYTIRMKLTPMTQLNGTWNYEDWTTVWTPEEPFTAELGWNIHECLVPFYWDGVSSILVETCFSHWNTIGFPNPQQYWTTTPVARCQYRSVYEPEGPEQDYCAIQNATAGTTRMNRANIRFGIEDLAIVPPLLISPLDGQFPVPVTPTFVWTEPDGAVGYTLQVSTSPLFDNLVIEEEGIPDPTYEVPESQELAELSTYYWRVNATNGEDVSYWSMVRSFITLGELNAPALFTPTNYASNIPSSIPFDWDDVITAQNYQIQIATDAGFDNIVVDQLSPVSELQYGLDMTTTYWWRVRAINEFYTSPWSEEWTFSTGSFFVIGMGETYNTNTDYPAPYGNWYWGAKHQILLRADEILAAGGTAGDLTSLSFNIAAINTAAALTNFEIRMKQTTENTLSTTWDETDLTQVFLAPSLINVLGWNTHMFTNPFNWDGVSNILIDICFNNGSYTYNQSTYYTPTTYNSVRYFRNDAATVCSTPGGATVSMNRPNIMFSAGPSEPPPPIPTLISPLNAAVNQPLTPLLEWSFVEEAANYRVQLSNSPSFNNLIVDLTLPQYEYQVATELNYLTQYYWRVRSIAESGIASQWSGIWSFTTIQEITLPWTFTETDNFSSIMVPSTVNPMIGDRPMMEGDAIGLFYERTPDEWYCAGYALWNPSGVGIIVYGDDTQTAIKDGYAVNEPYTFRVWDGQALIEYDAYATYLLGPEAYEIGGFSMLATLVTNMAVSQDINLNTGWNMISGYVIPTDPSVETLFADFVGNLRIMKNSYSQMYVPAYNINTIVDWNNADGYLVNMLDNEVLTLTGEQIVPETTPLDLNFGWNLSAYYRDNPMSPVTALASLSPNLVLAKNNDGGIYSPMYGLNTIGNMLPGQGYYFYMNQAAALTYPANSAGKAIAGDDITPLAKHLVPQTSNTGNNATLLLSVNVSNGNEIGVYNTNNELIGSGAVYNGVAAVNIWGDNDITANLDGAKANELLTVKLYNANSNTLNDISLINIQEITNGLEQDGLYYNSNAIYLAKATAQNETALVMSITNIPNPVSSSTKFEFSLVNDDNAEIIIYNIRGEEIARLANGFYNAGTYSISFDASNLTSGAYNVVLRSGSQTASTIMMINK